MGGADLDGGGLFSSAEWGGLQDFAGLGSLRGSNGGERGGIVSSNESILGSGE